MSHFCLPLGHVVSASASSLVAVSPCLENGIDIGEAYVVSPPHLLAPVFPVHALPLLLVPTLRLNSYFFNSFPPPTFILPHHIASSPHSFPIFRILRSNTLLHALPPHLHLSSLVSFMLAHTDVVSFYRSLSYSLTHPRSLMRTNPLAPR
ncbi:hypothetical protein BJ165DRAFT_1500181 [Panaeolus papilionaceus]|nr:hypothetical protein BJ165DRAFT_1500181 [Panaeolus papilionaceus]